MVELKVENIQLKHPFSIFFFHLNGMKIQTVEKLTRYQTNLGLLKQSCDIKMFLFQRST